jgi:hypothetical protein
MTDDQLVAIFRRAAESALVEWYPDQWDRQADEADDLSQELWVWYLENPSTQRKMAGLSEPEAVETARIHATQILSRQALEGNTFSGRDLYSSDAVREALRGESTNEYLYDVLPYALENLANKNEAQAEAIRCRYDDGVVPGQNTPDHFTLVRAVKSVTQEVNVFYLTYSDEGIGSSASVFPETRKQRGAYADPTGNTAALLEEYPEHRQVLEETPIREFLGGAAAQPAFDLGKVKGRTARYRRTGTC